MTRNGAATWQRGTSWSPGSPTTPASRSRPTESVPAWAAALVRPPSPEVIGQIELWRAAHQIPDSDLRPTGPVQHHLLEARAQHRLDALIAGESEPVLNWLSRIHQAAPGTIEDPATIRLARECAEVDPDGHSLPRHLEHALRRPLPDDHKADALRYRLEAWLHPVWEIVRTADAPSRFPTPTASVTRPTPRWPGHSPMNNRRPSSGRTPTQEGNDMTTPRTPRVVKQQWISLREAAIIYGVSTYTLRRRIASGDLPAVKLGYKIIRVRIEDLNKLFPILPTTRPEDRYRRW